MAIRKRIKQLSKQRRLSFAFNSKRWLRNANDIKEYRELLIKQQSGMCAVTNEPLTKPVVDHDHLNFNTRGCINSFVNMVEGKFFKLFMKYVNKHTKLSYGDFLIKLGEYLNKNYSESPWHFMSIDKIYKRLNYCSIQTIRDKILKDFGQIPEESLDKNQLRMLYCDLVINRRELEDENL